MTLEQAKQKIAEQEEIINAISGGVEKDFYFSLAKALKVMSAEIDSGVEGGEFSLFSDKDDKGIDRLLKLLNDSASIQEKLMKMRKNLSISQQEEADKMGTFSAEEVMKKAQEKIKAAKEHDDESKPKKRR